jgi:biofilm PGA synthesis N-glycosyltransferase PgaC
MCVNSQPSYVLVTPVRDEEATIGRTIESVLNQTILPREWVIVSDGSTDRTNAIIRQASAQHPWLRLLALAPRPARSFAAVVHNTETGIRYLNSKDYRFLGLLDSDVMFQNDYFERLLGRFETESALGLAGGVVIDVGLPRDRFPRNRADVPGAVQFFRRECFEKIGGLIPIPEGGWDGMSCAMARMKGYQTRLFTDLVVDHLKPRNVAEGGVVRRKWQMGVRDYAAGYHPVFEGVKCISRLKDRPLIVGALAWWVGYCTAALQRRPRIVSPSVVAYIRREQMGRLRGLFPLREVVRPEVVADMGEAR